MDKYEKTVRELLELTDIEINGKNPWDIQVLDQRFYQRVLSDGSIGAGEAYMDGWWDTDELDELVARINRVHLTDKINKNFKMMFFLLRHKIINTATVDRSYKVGKVHYDVGNELYEKMLDQNMNYTCGYWKGMGNLLTAWKDPRNLEKAQIAKMDLLCRKLYLKKGEKLLDTGCGFGNFARYAAKTYGVHVVGFTVSEEQAKMARLRCKGLPVEIRFMDYREMKPEKFDKIASIGMMEHVTYKNYETYMTFLNSCLKEEGLLLLHTIGSNTSVISTDPWTEKYIFPNSHLPSIAQMAHAAEHKFTIEDIQNFGSYYYPTLMSWYTKFDKAWPELTKKYPEKYDQRFYRMWKFYLLSSAGGFKSRDMQLFQILFSKSKKLGVYEAAR
jgi:cyclopropane-fatty-acyl-phospholipid synthase